MSFLIWMIYLCVPRLLKPTVWNDTARTVLNVAASLWRLLLDSSLKWQNTNFVSFQESTAFQCKLKAAPIPHISYEYGIISIKWLELFIFRIRVQSWAFSLFIEKKNRCNHFIWGFTALTFSVSHQKNKQHPYWSIILFNSNRLSRYHQWSSWKIIIMSRLSQPEDVCFWSHQGPWPW